MAVRRLEGEGGGGGDISMEGVREGVEDIGCKPQKDIMGIVTPSKIVRRGVRVSNIVNFLEEGAKQNNKIISYFSKSGGRMDSGHPLARTKLCDSGTKRRNYESENNQVKFDFLCLMKIEGRKEKLGLNDIFYEGSNHSTNDGMI